MQKCTLLSSFQYFLHLMFLFPTHPFYSIFNPVLLSLHPLHARISLSLFFIFFSLSLSSLFFSLSFLYFSRFPLSYLVPLISFPLLAKMKMREREREREREKRKTFNAKQSRHHKWFPSFSRFHLFFSFPLKCQSVFAGPSSRHHHKKNSTNWT